MDQAIFNRIIYIYFVKVPDYSRKPNLNHDTNKVFCITSKKPRQYFEYLCRNVYKKKYIRRALLGTYRNHVTDSL